MSVVAAQFSWPRNEQGQTFIEYALVLAVVVVTVLLAATWASLLPLIQAAMDAVAGAV